MLFALPRGEGDRMEKALELFEKLACEDGARELIELGIPRFECETMIFDFGMQLEAAGVYPAAAPSSLMPNSVTHSTDVVSCRRSRWLGR